MGIRSASVLQVSRLQFLPHFTCSLASGQTGLHTQREWSCLTVCMVSHPYTWILFFRRLSLTALWTCIPHHLPYVNPSRHSTLWILFLECLSWVWWLTISNRIGLGERVAQSWRVSILQTAPSLLHPFFLKPTGLIYGVTRQSTARQHLGC